LYIPVQDSQQMLKGAVSLQHHSAFVGYLAPEDCNFNHYKPQCRALCLCGTVRKTGFLIKLKPLSLTDSSLMVMLRSNSENAQ
jgi:hypothetical protein